VSCIVQCTCVNGTDRDVVRRGTEPRKPTTWQVKAWLILGNGEKHTHLARIPNQTIRTLIPWMGDLIDSLIAEHGNVVTSAGWTASTHGSKR
jgi:hypothetical protein